MTLVHLAEIYTVFSIERHCKAQVDFGLVFFVRVTYHSHDISVISLIQTIVNRSEEPQYSAISPLRSFYSLEKTF